MARKFKLFGQEVMIGKRLFGVGKDDDYVGIVNYGSDIKALRKLDAYKGLVYACINRIADQYATYEPYVEKKIGREWKAQEDHEFLQLLRSPGGRDDKAIPISMFDLLFATAAFIELQGDVYWYLPQGNISGKPREIIILRADKVGYDLDDKGEIKNYYVRQNGSKILLDINEILPFVGFNPKSPYKGLGTTEAGDDYIETEKYTTQFTKNFFKNNAGISGILSFPGDITKGAFRKAVRAWRDKYQGVDNAGRVMMLRGDQAKFEKIGLGLNELDMNNLRKMSREDIALMFGVPLALLGKADDNGLGRANIEALEYIFSKYTIEPKLKRLDHILQFALERYWKTTDLRIAHENIIPEDKEFELQERNLAVDRWLTRNEIRAEEGDIAVTGGDDLRTPFNSMPISQDTSAASSTQNSAKGGIKIKIKRKGGTAPVDTKKKDSIDSVHKENFRLELMRNQIIYERRYKKKFNEVLADQRKEALDNLEAHASSINSKTKEFGQKLFDDGAADKLIEQKIMPTLTNLGEEQGALALLFAGDDVSDFRMNGAYEKLLRASTQKMASNYNDETLDSLNRTLAEGIQAGEALDDLKNRVNDVYDGAKGYRAERVARTETLKASNGATNEAYRQTGYITGKEWYVNPDACDLCAPFDGKTVGLDETFIKQGESYDDANGDAHQNTYDDVDSPPLHPNCRCTIVPVR